MLTFCVGYIQILHRLPSLDCTHAHYTQNYSVTMLNKMRSKTKVTLGMLYVVGMVECVKKKWTHSHSSIVGRYMLVHLCTSYGPCMPYVDHMKCVVKFNILLPW